jgi:hypothetical protein
VARLHTLTPAQEMAILDAVERLRYTETARNRLPDEELVRVGLAYRPEDSPTGTTQPATAPQRRSQLRRRGGGADATRAL